MIYIYGAGWRSIFQVGICRPSGTVLKRQLSVQFGYWPSIVSIEKNNLKSIGIIETKPQTAQPVATFDWERPFLYFGSDERSSGPENFGSSERNND